MEKEAVIPQIDGLPVIVVTGPVGVGKTTVGMSISERLGERSVAHALVDLDWLRWRHPAPEYDPFHVALGMKNLAAVCANYRAEGIERLILVDVVETREQKEDYEAALPGSRVLIARLAAPLDTILGRLAGRETGDSLEWYRRRAPELMGIMERNRVEDLLVDTDGKTPAETADELLQEIGWI
jgi:hypothetical protein